MVYQNNNNRVNPDAVVDARIAPVATPTNQEIRYRDSSQDKARQTAAMAEGLASLGQGVIALSPVMLLLKKVSRKQELIKMIGE